MRDEQGTSVWVGKYLSQGGKEIKRLTERKGNKNCEYLKNQRKQGISSVFIVEIAFMLLTKNICIQIESLSFITNVYNNMEINF